MTQRDLMTKFSVSQATVSMALNNNPAISEKLRRDIQQAAAEMGYRPNLAGQMLRKGKSNLLGVILPSLYYSFYSELLAELHIYAQKRGYVIMLEHCESYKDFTFAMQSMERFNVAGIMAVCAAEWLAEWKGREIPFVLLHGNALPDTLKNKVSQVYPDMYQSGYDLADYLISSGRKHLLYLGKNNDRESRFCGFSARCAAAGIMDLPAIPGRENTTEMGYELAEKILQIFPETDAVAVHNDNMAMGVLRYFWEKRIDVPGRVAVAGFDNIREDTYTTPALTSIGPDRGCFARQALDELLMQIAFPEHHQEIKVRCELKARESA